MNSTNENQQQIKKVRTNESIPEKPDRMEEPSAECETFDINKMNRVFDEMKSIIYQQTDMMLKVLAETEQIRAENIRTGSDSMPTRKRSDRVLNEGESNGAALGMEIKREVSDDDQFDREVNTVTKAGDGKHVASRKEKGTLSLETMEPQAHYSGNQEITSNTVGRRPVPSRGKSDGAKPRCTYYKVGKLPSDKAESKINSTPKAKLTKVAKAPAGGGGGEVKKDGKVKGAQRTDKNENDARPATSSVTNGMENENDSNPPEAADPIGFAVRRHTRKGKLGWKECTLCGKEYQDSTIWMHFILQHSPEVKNIIEVLGGQSQ